MNGQTILPALKSGQTETDRALFWHYPHYGNQGGAPRASVLKGDWKLIEWFEDDCIELFNLANDPSETKNLAADSETPEIESMRQKLHASQKEMGAVRATLNPHCDSSKPDGRK